MREDGGRLVCERCAKRYEVRDGIPIMLADPTDPPEPGQPTQT